jgi:hypothetical protein
MVSTRSANKNTRPGEVAKPPSRRSKKEVAREKAENKSKQDLETTSKSEKLARLAELEEGALATKSGTSPGSTARVMDADNRDGQDNTGHGATSAPMTLKIRIGRRKPNVAGKPMFAKLNILLTSLLGSIISGPRKG